MLEAINEEFGVFGLRRGAPQEFIDFLNDDSLIKMSNAKEVDPHVWKDYL